MRVGGTLRVCLDNFYYICRLQQHIEKSVKMISYQCEGVEMPPVDVARISKWLTGVATGYGKRIGELSYLFCSDEEILRNNREFLGHDYYTDIITFDYTVGHRVGADILISVDTVRSNADKFEVSYEDELHRVIVHGLLHLCGLKDKTAEERASMESAENEALKALAEME